MIKLDPEIEKKLETIASGAVAADAVGVDREGRFPQASMDALAAAA
jgi:hypothetical protein